MKLTIRHSALRAAANCVAKKDIREYLCGVHVYFDVATMYAQVSGTDGCMLMTGRVPFTFEGEPQSASWSIIIPTSAIPKKGADITLESLADGRYMLGDTAFSSIPGIYPDLSRVIPTAADFASVPPAPGVYDPALLLRAHDALHTFYGTSKGAFYLHQRGHDMSSIMAGHDSDALAIIMPMRASHDGAPPSYQFNRDSLEPR